MSENTKPKVYVASSWRNKHYPDVVSALTIAGYEVHDWRDPKATPQFDWTTLGMGDFPTWGPEEYRDALSAYTVQEGFGAEYRALLAADCCVLVLPAGASAHMVAGWAMGRGLPLLVLIPDIDEITTGPELMYLMADYSVDTSGLFSDIPELVDFMREIFRGD